jgi:hypothetical protein
MKQLIDESAVKGRTVADTFISSSWSRTTLALRFTDGTFALWEDEPLDEEGSPEIEFVSTLISLRPDGRYDYYHSLLMWLGVANDDDIAQAKARWQEQVRRESEINQEIARQREVAYARLQNRPFHEKFPVLAATGYVEVRKK